MPYEFTQSYQRSDNDFYVEPQWSIEALINNVDFVGAIHDPACGSGKIPKTFQQRGFEATGSDLRDRGFGEPGIDFLKTKEAYENIVTNPPYNISELFIRHALQFAERRIAILARIAFLNGQKRYKLYKDFPPERIVILSRRPSMPPGGQLIIPQGGKTDFCWIVWNRKFMGETSVRWSL